jgi:hypothetical protein
MRKLTEQDLAAIIGGVVEGYTIEKARIKGGEFTDSDHYGIVLGKDSSGDYVTWQFHLIDEKPNVYWGHYFAQDRDAAVRDFNARK